MTPDLPRLRAVEPLRFVRDGEPVIALRDPLQLAADGGTMVVPPAMAPLLALVDGTRDHATLARDVHALHGLELAPTIVDALIDALDERCLLDNARATAARDARLAAWRDLPERPASHAGAVYPAQPEALRAAFADWIRIAAHRGDLTMAQADAVIAASSESAETAEPIMANGATLAVETLDAVATADPIPTKPTTPARSTTTENPAGGMLFPFGLLSPHIDYGRGGATYGAVWAKAAAAARMADRAILIGTDHGGPPGSVTLTRQSYATPFGRLPTPQALVDRLADALGEDAVFSGELRHRDEHAIELVALWLHYVRGGRPLPMLPILVGGFDHYAPDPEAPFADPRIRTLVDELRAIAADGRTLVIASGDLAHVGPAFHGAPLDGPARARLAGTDGELTSRITAADPSGFLAAIQRVANGNNVCGVAPLWLAMQIVQPSGGAVTAYQQCPADEQDTSWVSVVGATFS